MITPATCILLLLYLQYFIYYTLVTNNIHNLRGADLTSKSGRAAAAPAREPNQYVREDETKRDLTNT